MRETVTDYIPQRVSMRDADYKSLGGLTRQRSAALINNSARDKDWNLFIRAAIEQVHDCIDCCLKRQHMFVAISIHYDVVNYCIPASLSTCR